MVFSLNEVPDGSADSMIEDISHELAKVRDIASALGFQNPERINWTLFISSTSDSASSQKRFNRLVEEHRKEDEERYGPASDSAIELVENLCAMHLGSNLRKAFLEGKNVAIDATAQFRQHDNTDTVIHEFCKLFGVLGVPENGCGISFSDFLALRIESEMEEVDYYQSCSKIQLERQVGSRYFVSASNAAKIFFLHKAAIEYLKYSGKDEGNNLERTLYHKLQDSHELACLKADALMFYFVYSELVMLAKSDKLNKSALDMNKHYLELYQFLQKIEDDPEVIRNEEYKVFFSENSLYGEDKTVNHRIRTKNRPIYSRLFQEDDFDTTVLYPLLVSGATKMREKLSHYAKNQLPGGKYWEPHSSVAAILKELKPNNDVCESILGLNDYLATTIPNMHPMTRSNLVEVKKNKTLKWYQDLPSEQKTAVTNLAVKSRRCVMHQYREEEKQRRRQRQEHMKFCHLKKQKTKQRAEKERDMLSQQHLITTAAELEDALQDIDVGKATAASKRRRKLALLQLQIRIRKKILCQHINIPLSRCGKKRPLDQVTRELIQFIEANPQHPNPSGMQGNALVGKRILHLFQLDSCKERWYSGTVLSYDARNNSHEILYDGEEEHQHFDLTEDIKNGEIKIIS